MRKDNMEENKPFQYQKWERQIDLLQLAANTAELTRVTVNNQSRLQGYLAGGANHEEERNGAGQAAQASREDGRRETKQR